MLAHKLLLILHACTLFVGSFSFDSRRPSSSMIKRYLKSQQFRQANDQVNDVVVVNEGHKGHGGQNGSKANVNANILQLNQAQNIDVDVGHKGHGGYGGQSGSPVQIDQLNDFDQDIIVVNGGHGGYGGSGGQSGSKANVNVNVLQLNQAQNIDVDVGHKGHGGYGGKSNNADFDQNNKLNQDIIVVNKGHGGYGGQSGSTANVNVNVAQVNQAQNIDVDVFHKGHYGGSYMTNEYRCGKDYEGKKCEEGYCCSKEGYCGNTDPWCLVSAGCQKDYGECREDGYGSRASLAVGSQSFRSEEQFIHAI